MCCFRMSRDRRGTVLVFVAILIVVLLGMAALAMDIGQMYIARQRAQNVCDGTALSGIYEMAVHYGDTTVAESEAVVAATQCADSNNSAVAAWRVCYHDPNNGQDVPGVNITFPTGTIPTDNPAVSILDVQQGEAIRTEGYVNVTFGFARILGFTSKKVLAKATAVLGPPSSEVCGLVPLSVNSVVITGVEGQFDGIQLGQIQVIHIADPNDPNQFYGPGNFFSLSFFDDRGGNVYRDRLSGDKDTCLSPTGTIEVSTEPGKMVGPTIQGIEQRLYKETYAPLVYPDMNSTAWDSWLATEDDAGLYRQTWRLVIIPIIAGPLIEKESGRYEVNMVGLAGFFIENVGKDEEKRSYLEGRFVPGIQMPDGTIRWTYDPNDTGVPDPTKIIKTIRLVS